MRPTGGTCEPFGVIQLLIWILKARSSAGLVGADDGGRMVRLTIAGAQVYGATGLLDVVSTSLNAAAARSTASLLTID
ncbi:hypothetical protein ASG62_08020 [Aureimonas sp. Leaf427]|nr:hypothetical protein ASG62_08020 [Aureimonas sp. Leaf427]